MWSPVLLVKNLKVLELGLWVLRKPLSHHFHELTLTQQTPKDEDQAQESTKGKLQRKKRGSDSDWCICCFRSRAWLWNGPHGKVQTMSGGEFDCADLYLFILHICSIILYNFFFFFFILLSFCDTSAPEECNKRSSAPTYFIFISRKWLPMTDTMLS